MMAEKIQQEKEQQPNLPVKLHGKLRNLSTIPTLFLLIIIFTLNNKSDLTIGVHLAPNVLQ